MFGNQIKQPVNECSEEICFAILIMVLHELFELDAHILYGGFATTAAYLRARYLV